MTLPRHRFGRTTLAAASLLAISTLSTIASPATAEPSSAGDEAITPGPTPADVRTLGDPVAGPRDLDARGTALPTARPAKRGQRARRRHRAVEPTRHAGLDPPSRRQPRCRPRCARRRGPGLAA